jgi:hypothetical protein
VPTLTSAAFAHSLTKKNEVQILSRTAPLSDLQGDLKVM